MMERLGYVKVGDIVDYLKKHPLTEEQLVDLTVHTLGEFNNRVWAKEEEEALFKALSEVENFQEYLRLTLVKDIKRYFQASTPVEQLTTKGAYARTLYLKNSLVKSKEKGKVKVEEKIDSPRYAS